MHVLIVGGSGLIGRNIVAHLAKKGHQVTVLSRLVNQNQTDTSIQHISVDLNDLTEPEYWHAFLKDIDVVINAAGIIVEQKTQTFEVIHKRAPIALFSACVTLNIKKIIQISALGAHPKAATAYWRSKADADAMLMNTTLNWTVLRPSLVYSDEGASSRLFRQLASMPVVPNLKRAGLIQPVFQPVHIDDLVGAISIIVEGDKGRQQCIDAVGIKAVSWREWMAILRLSMDMPPARYFSLTGSVVMALSKIAQFLPGSIATPDNMTMLFEGNAANNAQFALLVGQPLRDASSFAHPALKAEAILSWWLILARQALAFLWLWTAFVSFYNLPESINLLEQTGINPKWQDLLLISSIGMDVVLGLGTMFYSKSWFWGCQICLVAIYTVIISICMPVWWRHPFGAISKNMIVLVVLLLLERFNSK